MKYPASESTQSQITLETGSFVSLKDYFVGEEQSTNPYASIDDFLDETWNVNFTSTNTASEATPPSNYS